MTDGAMRSKYYDKQGKPLLTVEAWGILFENRAYQRLALDEFEVGGVPVKVSTVWLGMDHRMGPEGPPIIFETMVFGGRYDEEQEQYATEAEALAGHARWLEKVRTGN